MAADALDAAWAAYTAAPSAETRNAVVLAAQPNVVSTVRNMRVPDHVDREDLVSIGQFGVYEAIEKFDPKRDASFSTWVNRRVRFKVLDEIRGEDWAPRRVRREGRELDAAERAVQARHQRPATDAEVADELGVTEEDLAAMRTRQLGAQVYSTDHDDFGDLADPATDSSMFDPEQVREVVARALTRVTDPRQKHVLVLYFVEGMTGPEIAKVLGCSKGHVSTLRDQALLALRSGLAEAG